MRRAVHVKVFHQKVYQKDIVRRLVRHVTRDAKTQALDEFVLDQLSGIERTFNELTERLGDPDILGDPKLLVEVSQERAGVEEVGR